MKKNLSYCLLLLFCVSGLFVSCGDDDDEKPTIGYSGKDISGDAGIARDKETKKAVLSVTSDKAWELYAGSTAEDIDMDTPCLTGNGKGSFDLSVDATKRQLFLFKNSEGQALLAEKLLPVNGYNFRDLGGIKNSEGKYVRWGRLFRTDEMNKLSDADLAYLVSTGLKTVVDFRTATEKEGGLGGMLPAAPDKLPSTVKNPYNLEINAGNIFSDEIIGSISKGLSEEETAQIMIDGYIEMVSYDDYVAKYKDFFKYVQDANSLPLSYHCSAGKDRTGVATMLILSALGVDKETIMKDYMLSKEYIKGKYDSYLKYYPQIAPLVTVDEKYLNAAYNKIDEKYGSMTKFLTETLGVDLDKMKQLYLY